MKELNYKSISDTNIMEDFELDQVEAGMCSAGCKKSCHDGGANRRGPTIEIEIPGVGKAKVENL